MSRVEELYRVVPLEKYVQEVTVSLKDTGMILKRQLKQLLMDGITLAMLDI